MTDPAILLIELVEANAARAAAWWELANNYDSDPVLAAYQAARSKADTAWQAARAWVAERGKEEVARG